MKKLIFLIILLASTICYAQDGDPSIRLGQLKLRYDRDSNALRIELTGPSYGSFRLYKGPGLGLTNLFSVSSDLSWSAGTLGLSSPLSHDTSWVKKFTIYKDTTYSENTYSKNWTLKRRFFNQRNNSDLYWYYLNTVDNSLDSSKAINTGLEVDNETSVSMQYTGTYALIDSVVLDAGYYIINFGIMFERTDLNNVAIVGLSDTVEMALKQNGSAPNVYIKRYLRNIHTYSDANDISGDILTWCAYYQILADQTKVYLYGRYLGTAISNAISSGQTVPVKRGFITSSLLR